jgi:hypothetical protein
MTWLDFLVRALDRWDDVGRAARSILWFVDNKWTWLPDPEAEDYYDDLSFWNMEGMRKARSEWKRELAGC